MELRTHKQAKAKTHLQKHVCSNTNTQEHSPFNTNTYILRPLLSRIYPVFLTIAGHMKEKKKKKINK